MNIIQYYFNYYLLLLYIHSSRIGAQYTKIESNKKEKRINRYER